MIMWHKFINLYNQLIYKLLQQLINNISKGNIVPFIYI